MKSAKKSDYIEPKLIIIEVDEMDLVLCGSNESMIPEVQDNEEEEANPYWNVL